MGTLIEVENLKKYFKVKKGFLHAVDDVSFKIDSGKTFGVVGESGCGKSTLGRLILRLLEPTDGKVLYDGKNILELNRREMKKARHNMQIIMQDPYSSVNPRMTVRDIIADPLIVNKIYENKRDVDLRVKELMDVVGLSNRVIYAYPHELDGGRRQRVGIARALALNPKFVVCDEPVSALDVSIQAQTLNLLMDLQEQLNLTYMFITHDLSVVKHVSHDVIVMYLGKIVERADSDVLFNNPLHPYSKALLRAIPVPDIDYYKENELEIIKGEITSPINPPIGCRFAARCPNACKECTETEIKEIEVEPNHFVSCILYK